ncbi:hypothetical protein [Mycobacterium avium]|uniref:hypothetical protein n=1 Tax=Mycobacterium avium TaxID=1764 RepID=UPI001F29A025|nr:hypothetical protein [Mycobacterium avium]
MQRRDPLWQLPHALETLGEHVSSRCYRAVGSQERALFPGIHVHPQTVAENGVDPHHHRDTQTSPTPPRPAC